MNRGLLYIGSRMKCDAMTPFSLTEKFHFCYKKVMNWLYNLKFFKNPDLLVN